MDVIYTNYWLNFRLKPFYRVCDNNWIIDAGNGLQFVPHRDLCSIRVSALNFRHVQDSDSISSSRRKQRTCKEGALVEPTRSLSDRRSRSEINGQIWSSGDHKVVKGGSIPISNQGNGLKRILHHLQFDWRVHYYCYSNLTSLSCQLRLTPPSHIWFSIHNF